MLLQNLYHEWMIAMLYIMDIFYGQAVFSQDSLKPLSMIICNCDPDLEKFVCLCPSHKCFSYGLLRDHITVNWEMCFQTFFIF